MVQSDLGKLELRKMSIEVRSVGLDSSVSFSGRQPGHQLRCSSNTAGILSSELVYQSKGVLGFVGKCFERAEIKVVCTHNVLVIQKYNSTS